MKVRLTEDAEADLVGIGDFIAVNSPRRAETFVNELIGRCQGLVSQPYGSVLVPRYEVRGVRRAIYGRYLIFYRVEPETIVVLRILHGSIDYEGILFPDG